jgi:hypothetical protein
VLSKYWSCLICLSFILGIDFVGCFAHAAEVTHVRLYAIDCGRADFKDMALFSDTGEYDGNHQQGGTCRGIESFSAVWGGSCPCECVHESEDPAH